jgi:hypothetical protein
MTTLSVVKLSVPTLPLFNSIYFCSSKRIYNKQSLNICNTAKVGNHHDTRNKIKICKDHIYERHYVECHVLFNILLNVIMVNVIMLNVVTP